MTEAHAAADSIPTPDPFHLQITAMIVESRAHFLPHDAGTFARLEGIVASLLRNAASLIDETGAQSPFSPGADDEAMPPEVFLETPELIGLTQAVPRPSIGMAIRHFRLVRREEAEHSRIGPNTAMARALAVVDLIQHPNTWWQVLHAEVKAPLRRQGVATMLYDRIAEVLGCEMRPSGWLSDDGYQFWLKRGHFTMEWYRQPENLGGLWINPRSLAALIWLAEREMLELAGEGQTEN